MSLGGLGLAVLETESGGSPLDEAISSGGGESAAVDPTAASNWTGFSPVTLVPVEHICGNGKRSSAEACDDGNTDPLDGCDASSRLVPSLTRSILLAHSPSGLRGLLHQKP